MYERMLEKSNIPSEEDILTYLGKDSENLLHYFEAILDKRYDLVKVLKYPFGNNYGWGYKYSHKTKHLCYLFFEQSAFTVLLQISEKDKSKLEKRISGCLPKTRELWEQRYPCGDGGWMNYQVFQREELEDIVWLLEIKKKPNAL